MLINVLMSKYCCNVPMFGRKVHGGGDVVVTEGVGFRHDGLGNEMTLGYARLG